MYAIKPWKAVESTTAVVKPIRADFLVKSSHSLDHISPVESQNRTLLESNNPDRTSVAGITEQSQDSILTNSTIGIEAEIDNMRLTDTLDVSQVDGLIITSSACGITTELLTSSSTSVTSSLPSSSLPVSPGQNSSGGKGVSAKDKRKIREKRRSTGVAKLNDIFGDDHRDSETISNTVINESITEESDPCISREDYVTNIGKTDSSVNQSNQILGSRSTINQPADVGSVATGQCLSPSKMATKSCLKPPPPVSQKPFSLRDYSSKLQSTQSSETRSQTRHIVDAESTAKQKISDNVAEVSNHRIQELERTVKELQMKLAEEQAKNLILEQTLVEKEAGINDLQMEVDALNQDLDLADEEFEKLEAENRAILRTLANLQVHPS